MRQVPIRYAPDDVVFVVGSGPSLEGFRFTQLDHRRVVAVNREYEFLPYAEVVYWSDREFFDEHAHELLAHQGHLATGHIHPERISYPARVHVYRFTGAQGYDPRPGHLRSGNNSGHAAVHLAVDHGARRLVTLGFDFRHLEGRTHHHDGHVRRGVPQRTREVALREKMLPYFGPLAAELTTMGVRVVNVSEISLLEVWPRAATVEQALAMLEDDHLWT